MLQKIQIWPKYDEHRHCRQHIMAEMHDIPKDMVIFETDPENMYVRKPRRTNNGQAEEKKIPDDYIEYYI